MKFWGVLVCPFLCVVIDETRGFPCFIEVPLVCPLSPTAASATHRFLETNLAIENGPHKFHTFGVDLHGFLLVNYSTGIWQDGWGVYMYLLSLPPQLPGFVSQICPTSIPRFFSNRLRIRIKIRRWKKHQDGRGPSNAWCLHDSCMLRMKYPTTSPMFEGGLIMSWNKASWFSTV